MNADQQRQADLHEAADLIRAQAHAALNQSAAITEDWQRQEHQDRAKALALLVGRLRFYADGPAATPA